MAHSRHFLVTAGSTWEKIDEVRRWGNIFTGQTGLEAARALLDLGAVTLLTSNARHAAEFDGYSGASGMLGVELYQTHAELRELIAERLAGTPTNAVLMTAAVSDYQPAGVYRVLEQTPGPNGRMMWTVESVQAAKVKSSHGTIAVLGQATEKIIDLFRSTWNYQGLLIKFKLEAGVGEQELLKVAEASRQASGADYIVANTLEMVHGPTPGAYLLGETLNRRVARAELAGALRDLVASNLVGR